MMLLLVSLKLITFIIIIIIAAAKLNRKYKKAISKKNLSKNIMEKTLLNDVANKLRWYRNSLYIAIFITLLSIFIFTSVRISTIRL